MPGQSLRHFSNLTLGRTVEVLGNSSERLDISRRPLVSRFENDRRSLAMNQDRIALEATLLWQPDRLASPGPENACGLPLRRCLSHDSYQ